MLCKAAEPVRTLWDAVKSILDIQYSTLLYVLMAFGLELCEKFVCVCVAIHNKVVCVTHWDNLPLVWQ